MKWLVFMVAVVALLVVALALTNPTQWGTVTFAFGDTTYQVNAIDFALALIGLFIALRLLGALFNLPWRIIRTSRARRLERLRREFEESVALYLQGQWQTAHKRLLRVAQEPALAHTANLLAAHCAIKDNRFEAARAALQAAREADIRDDFYVPLTQSEILLKSGQPEQAAEHLDKLRHRQPDNRKIVDLLMQACATMDDWGMLTDSLPQLRKLYARQPDKLRAIELPVARKLLQQTAESMNEKALKQQWHHTAATVRPALLTFYVQMLVKVGAEKTAEFVLREAIESRWDEDCMMYYGDMKTDNVDERLAHAERWLKSRPKDPALLLCLGKLYCQAALWDQARHYLKTGLSLDPKPEVFRELISTFDYVGGGQF